MSSFAPQGVYCAMVTPYDDQGGINLHAIESIIDFLIERRVDGVFPVSNVGEFLLYSMEEKKAVIRTVIERAQGKLKVTPGISDVSIERCYEMAQFCKQAGVDGVVLCAPYYYDAPKRYLYDFMKSVADKSPLPITLYNSPLFTNALEFEDLLALCRHPNITGIKESSGSLQFLMTLVNALKTEGNDIHVLLGFEELLHAGLSIGVKGCMVSSGGIVPEIMRGIFDHHMQGDIALAQQYELALVRVTDAVKAHGFPLGYKMGVRARGIPFHFFRGREFSSLDAQYQQQVPYLTEVIERELSKLSI